MSKFRQRQGTTVELDESVLAELENAVRGRLVSAIDSDYHEIRQIWNAMIDRRPALIARCSGAADVIACVRFAERHDLLVSIRGGGHNIAGSALCDGGLTIDLSQMRGIQVDAQARRARVQAGALLGDLDHETQAFGLAVPLGVNSTTGVAGLALGGGYGWLSRAFGHTVDNIVSLDVVTPDGELRRASADENPDLFWALRGGSGNFGVVTAFEFQLHPVGPAIMSGPVVHRLDDAPAVLREYREIARSLPDGATCWTVLRKAPPLPFLATEHHGTPVLIMAMTCVGEFAAAEEALAGLRAIGTPLADGVSPHPYTGWQRAFDPLVAPRARNYWKSQDFIELHDEVIDAMVAAARQLPGSECEIFTAQLGGVAGRVAATDMAYPHRATRYTMNVHGRWQDVREDEACITWVQRLYEATAAGSTGGVYVNFVPESGEERALGPFGSNQARLEQVKQIIDPLNRFRTNINITPATT